MSCRTQLRCSPVSIFFMTLLSACFIVLSPPQTRAATYANATDSAQRTDQTSPVRASIQAQNNQTSLRANQHAAMGDSNGIRIGFFYLNQTIEKLGISRLYDALDARVDRANQVLSHSEINGQFIFSHLAPWPGSDHAALHDQDALKTYTAMEDMIQNLTTSGYFKQYGIDVIFLVDFRVSDSFCGWASINTLEDLKDTQKNRSYGLLRLGAGCNLDAMALIHEIGHLFGAAHGTEEPVTPSDHRGHGYYCDGKYTVMHTRHAKHSFFSNPWHESSGELCGEIDKANVKDLIAERFPLLANRTRTPDTHATLSVTIEKNPSSITLIFERFGWVDPTAEFDLYLEGHNSFSTHKTETAITVSFAPGELLQQVNIPLQKDEKTADQKSALASRIFLMNPHKLTLPFQQSAINAVMTQATLSQLSYSVSGNTVRLNAQENIPDLPQWHATEIAWGDGEKTSPAQAEDTTWLSHTYRMQQAYTIVFSGYDTAGTYHEISMAVDLTSDEDTSRSVDMGSEASASAVNAQANSARQTPENGGSGGSVTLFLLTLMGFVWARRSIDR